MQSNAVRESFDTDLYKESIVGGSTGDTVEIFLHRDSSHLNSARHYNSRVLDVLMSIGILMMAIPAVLFIALAIKLDSRGPVIYRQKRVGLNGVEFDCLKFRTMSTTAAEELDKLLAGRPEMSEEFATSRKLRHDPRITRVGRILRPLGLDEFPQFVNILRGDMSVVGPRPFPVAELERYGTVPRGILSVRPGLTGAWQVGGRSDTTYDERVAIELDYVKTRNRRLDLAILVRTVRLFLTGSIEGGY